MTGINTVIAIAIMKNRFFIVIILYVLFYSETDVGMIDITKPPPEARCNLIEDFFFEVSIERNEK
jgi:hypothetical protein